MRNHSDKFQNKTLIFRLLTPLICLLPSTGSAIDLSDAMLKNRVDSILSLMAFTVLPDVTTSALSIEESNNDYTDFFQTTFGGGFTWSRDFPLYLEGIIGYSRYNPNFIGQDGDETYFLPTKWNNFTLSCGIGWDFPITEDKELVLRPIFNISLGHMESDLSLLAKYLDKNFGVYTDDLEFLTRGRMNAYGLGGSMMLDWEHYRDDYEIDLELRYAHMRFTSFDFTYSSVKGSSDTDILSLWTRYRAPTGWTMFKKPFRYVLEGSSTVFLGNQEDILGFNYLTTLGVGIEFDTSDYPVFITRTRFIYRYTIGKNISGHTIGISMSF